MTIRKAKKSELSKCLDIVISLTDWFDEDDISKIKEAIHSLPVYVFIDNKDVIGFMCINPKFNTTIEIEYLAVDPKSRNKGVGTKLINYIEANLAKDKIIEVKTLDESRVYEPYAQTRAFFEKNGFKKIEVIYPFPGWSEGCPCAIHIKIK
jgi:N-acetylglutamate synthase-like GNAT family acetyltransferase